MSKRYDDDELKAKRAAYMREYNARPDSHFKKLLRDREYRKNNLEKIREYDRNRAKTVERRALVWKCGVERRKNESVDERRYHSEYYKNNREKWKAKSKKRRDRFTKEEWSEIQRNYLMKSKYGINREQYDKILLEQDGKCAICKCQNGESGVNGRLHIDHDHKTGKVRGLLCMRCNHSIERLDSFPDWHERAVDYLKKPR